MLFFSEETAEPHAIDEDLDASAAYGKAKKQGARKKTEDGPPKRGGDKAKGGGQTLNCFYRKTRLRNR